MFIPNDISTDNMLISQFRETLLDMSKKLKDPSIADEVGYPISYPTSFLPFDYRNGIRINTTHMYEDMEFVYDSIGIGEGSINMVIGKTGTAKTTWVMQAVASMMLPFLGRTMATYYDLEGGITKSRIQNVTGWNSRLIEKHISLKDKGINSEMFFETVVKHCELKLKNIQEHPEIMTYDTGLFDMYGKRRRTIVPSFIILDSLPLLAPKNMSEEEKIAGNMSAAAVAKINTQIFKRLTPTLKAANVILFVINHINQNININPFAPKQAQINYLKQEETLPGGTAPLYLSNNIIKFATSTKLTADKDFGINGWISKITLIKSRMNRAGQEFGMVYEQQSGFNRELSMFQMLHENDMINSGTWSSIKGMESKKFQKKSFIDKFNGDEEFRRYMKMAVTDMGGLLLSNSSLLEIDKKPMSETAIEDALFSSLISDYRTDAVYM